MVAVADTFYAMVGGKERGGKKIPFTVLEEMRKKLLENRILSISQSL
ncbi:hypothetical protein [Priestia filamentosa]